MGKMIKTIEAHKEVFLFLGGLILMFMAVVGIDLSSIGIHSSVVLFGMGIGVLLSVIFLSVLKMVK